MRALPSRDADTKTDTDADTKTGADTGTGTDADDAYQDARRTFAKRYGEYEQGDAAERVYQKFFAKGGRS